MENKNWVELPNTIIQSNLKDYTKLVYSYLEFHLFFQKEQELPSKNSISKTLNLKFETVNKAIQELTESGLLQDNNLYCLTKDNQIDETIFSNTEAFTIKEHVSKTGGFTKVPLEILSSKDLSSGERMSWIRIKSVKLDKIHWNGIATKTCIPLRTFERHIKSLKEKGYLRYSVKRNSNKIKDIEITDLKLFQAQNAEAIMAYEEEQKIKSNKIIETTKTEDNVVENKEKKMTDEEFDAILAAADDSPITKEETKAPISVESKAFEEEKKNEAIESKNADASKAESMASEKIINSNYTIEQFKNDRNVKVKVMSEADYKIEPIIEQLQHKDYNEHSQEEINELLDLI